MNEESFFSMNRLIEFGLGVSVAGQMIRMMNESLQQMYVPGAGNPLVQQPAMYYAVLEDKQCGPFSENEVAQLITQKQISVGTYMWKPGMPSWRMVSEMPDVLRIVALTPPEFKK